LNSSVGDNLGLDAENPVFIVVFKP
jgi:hypothetical protein